jgi:hypothetical protein
MSPSSFHQHFRTVTSRSPLQFQTIASNRGETADAVGWTDLEQRPLFAVAACCWARTKVRHTPRLVGQQRLDHAPLEVGQIISAHADVESEFCAMEKPQSATAHHSSFSNPIVRL